MVGGRHDDQTLFEAGARLARGGGEALGQRLQSAQCTRRLGEPTLPLARGGRRPDVGRRDALDGTRDACPRFERRRSLVLGPCLVLAQ